MVFDITDLLLGPLQPLQLRSICDNAEAPAFAFFKISFVLDLALQFTLLLQAKVFRCIRHCGEGLLWVVCIAIGLLFIAFVVVHVESHLADLAVETSFMPILI